MLFQSMRSRGRMGSTTPTNTHRHDGKSKQTWLETWDRKTRFGLDNTPKIPFPKWGSLTRETLFEAREF